MDTKRRLFITSVILGAFFFIILSRLFFLQIIKGETYLQKSKSNFVLERPIRHLRGGIFTNNGVPLVDNRASHDVYITFSMLPKHKLIFKKINSILDGSSFDNDIPNIELFENSVKILTVAQDVKYNKCIELSKYLEQSNIKGIMIDYYNTFSNSNCELQINLGEFLTEKSVFFKLQRILGISDEEMQQRLLQTRKKSQGLGRFKPVLFYSDVLYDVRLKLENAISLGDLPAVAIVASKQRRYINGTFGSHILGFVNEANLYELKNQKYKAGDRVGRKGIEQYYENMLCGKDGVLRSVVDAKGRLFDETWQKDLLGDERITPPVAGNDLYLSIDYEIQKIAEESFRAQAGSIVVLEAQTGFVQALVSIPEFDPNLLVKANNKQIVQSLASNPLKPWVNKAIQDNYAPGSTFKAMTAVAGLEYNMISSINEEIKCSGNFQLGKANWRCFKREGHGPIDFTRALQASCDGYFYRLGYELGTDKLYNIGKKFGFGEKTGLDLPQEIAGIMPSVEYYKKRLGYYTKGFVVNSAIGQGDVTVTPIQLAAAYVALVNGGNYYQPQLVKKIVSPQGEVIKENKPLIKKSLKEMANILNSTKLGLSYVLSAGGTAQGLRWNKEFPDVASWLREENPSIGGKTGTAQVVKLAKHINHLDPEKVQYLQRDHAWFVAFAPIDDPKIVVVVMTEHGGFGGTTSAPVALRIIKKWFEKQKKETYG